MTAPSPAPLARIFSASVPCGIKSTFSSPAFICAMVSGLVPMWETITLSTCLFTTSLPKDLSGNAVSLQIRVRPRTPFSTRASMILSGAPAPRKPPTITVIPSLILATASETEIILFIIFANLYLFFNQNVKLNIFIRITKHLRLYHEKSLGKQWKTLKYLMIIRKNTPLKNNRVRLLWATPRLNLKMSQYI